MGSGLMMDKVVLVAGGEGSPGSGIVNVLLKQGATVIVPMPDAASISKLRTGISAEYAAKLITYPTDFGDYDQAEELIEIIVSEFGPIDLVVAAVEKVCGKSPLMDADIREWCKTVDLNITASFIIDRLCLPLLGSNGGVLINISNTDLLLPGSGSPLAKISGIAGLEISKVFAEEARLHHIYYYHLLINNVAPMDAASIKEGELEITPARLADEVIRLYREHRQMPVETFHFFTGKAIDDAILNRLKG